MMSPFWQHHNQMIIAVVKYNVFIYIYNMLSKRENHNMITITKENGRGLLQKILLSCCQTQTVWPNSESYLNDA